MRAILLSIFLFAQFLGVLHAAEPIAVFAPGARILFQGDSITDGNRGRNADPNHILVVEQLLFVRGNTLPVE